MLHIKRMNIQVAEVFKISLIILLAHLLGINNMHGRAIRVSAILQRRGVVGIKLSNDGLGVQGLHMVNKAVCKDHSFISVT